MQSMSSGNSINDISGADGISIANSLSGRTFLFIYKTTKKEGSSKKYILPIPKGYSDTFENTWNNVDLGSIAGNTLSVLKGEKGVLEAASGIVAGVGNAVLDKFVGDAGLSEQKGAVENALSVGARKNLNPVTQLMYKSPALRQFQFSWTLKPKNAKQALLINQFVKDVREASYPSFESVGGVQQSGFFVYPSEFEVRVYGGNNKILVNTIACVCTSLQVQYDTEGNVYTHQDGRPVSTAVTISLQETGLLTRTQLENLYPL